MNNLTTRKIVLGMLMVLVLAFSVQGPADALEFKDHSSTDGDLRKVLPGKEFTIKFSITPGSNTTKIYLDGNLVDEDENRLDSSGYFIAQDTVDRDGDDDTEEFLRTPIEGKDKPTTLKRYHYNEEAVTITVSSGVTIKKVGSRTLNSEGPHKLSETGKDATKLSSSNTLILTATTEGPVTITISDATEDKPDDAIAVTDFVFTVYVVYTDFDSGFPGTVFGLSQGPKEPIGYNGFLSANDQFDPPIRADDPTPSLSIPVVYEVAEGSGSLYVAVPGQLDERRTRSAKTLETSSDANVYLDMNRSTNKINAWVSGRRGTTSSTATYIYGGGTLEMIEKMIESGNGQEGAIRGRLEDPLVVRVKDDKNKPVSGVPIEFEATDVTSGMFVPVSGTIVYVTDASALVATDNEPGTTVTEVDPTNPPAPAERIFVQTDRSGEAKTYFRLGTEPTGQTKQQVDFSPKTAAVSQSVNHLLRSPFRVTALDSEVSARIVIVDGDGQRGEAETPLEDSLIVLVRNIYDDRISGVNVRFTTTEGIISLRRGAVSNSDAENEDDISLPIKSGEEIFAKTDASGEVWVIYTVGSNASRQVVRAEIASEQDVELEYDFETLPVTFNINGGGTPSSDDDDDDEDEDDTAPASVTVTVPPTVTGPAGGTATLTVTAPATATVTAGGLGNTFLSTNVGSFTRSGTTFTSRLTLPNQVANYSLSVFVNNTRYPVTVSVTAATTQTQTGTLAVRIDPFSGAPGTTATVTVTATDSSAQSANVTVNLTATGGTLSSQVSRPVPPVPPQPPSHAAARRALKTTSPSVLPTILTVRWPVCHLGSRPQGYDGGSGRRVRRLRRQQPERFAELATGRTVHR